MKERSRLNVRQFCNVVFLGAAVVALLSQTFSVLLFYEAQSNYFQKGVFLPTIAVIFFLISIAAGTLSAYLSRPVGDSISKLRFIPLFPSIGFAVSGMELFIKATSTLEIACSIFLIASAIYSVLAFLTPKNLSELTIWLGFAPVLSFTLLTAHYYFDFTVEMNAPLKLMLQCGLLCAMLFYTGELRILLNRPAPRLYRMLCAWTVTAASFASVPAITAFLTGKTDRIEFLLVGILLSGVAASALLRLTPIQTHVSTNPDDTDSTI